MTLELLVRLKSDEEEVSLEEIRNLLEKELDEESSWWRNNFKFGLAGVERRAVWAFLMRKVLGNDRFREELASQARAGRS